MVLLLGKESAVVIGFTALANDWTELNCLMMFSGLVIFRVFELLFLTSVLLSFGLWCASNLTLQCCLLGPVLELLR